MNLKRYRVQNIQEALQQIKKDLGPDAIIVSTRQVKEGGGAFGMFSKTMLEVTAKDEKAQRTKAKTSKAQPTVSMQNNPQPQSTSSGYTTSALPAKPMTTKEGPTSRGRTKNAPTSTRRSTRFEKFDSRNRSKTGYCRANRRTVKNKMFQKSVR